LQLIVLGCSFSKIQLLFLLRKVCYHGVLLTLGFEVLSLDVKDAPSTIPDLSAPHMAHLARRLDGTRALGMFRISEKEFLLCYDGTVFHEFH
jgi:CNH domain